MQYMPLVNNITLLISLSIFHGLVIRRWRKGTWRYTVSTGIIFAVVAVVGMKNAFVLQPGVIFDGRSIIISTASFLGGPVTGLITVVICGAYRISIGGAGTWVGLGVIAASALIGVGYSRLAVKNRIKVNAFSLLIFGIVVHLVMLAMMYLLPGGLTHEAIRQVALPLMLIFPVATMVLGLFFVSQESKVVAEIQLEESEKNYRELAEGVNSVMVRWLPDGTVSYMNEYGLNLFGFSEDEIVGRHVVGSFIPPTDSSGMDLSSIVENICANPEQYVNNENENIRKDGSVLWMRWRNKALRNNAGEIEEFLSIGIDLTESKKVEERNIQLGQIIDNSIDEIFIFDAGSLKFLEVNLGAQQNLGYSMEELSEFTPVDLVPEYTAESLDEILQPLRDNTVNKLHLETEHRRKDGTCYPIEVHVQKSTLANREVFLAIILDISERKSSELALKASEENLRQRNTFIETILDNLPIGLAVNEISSTDTLYMNKMFEEIYGWPREKLDNVEHFFECVYRDPDYREEIRARIMTDIQSGKPERMVWHSIKITTEDGFEKFVDARNIPLPEQDMMISTVQDVTLGKLADDKLHQQSELLQSVLDNIPIMVMLTKTDSYFQWVNLTFEKVLGFSLGELQDIDILAQCYPDPDYRRYVAEFIDRAEGRWGEFKTRTKSGKLLDTQWLNIKTSDNTLISIGIDVTDKVRTEKQRKDMERQLFQSKKMEAIGRLAGGIAHDFNNMLLVILGNAQLALTQVGENDQLQRDIHEIQRAAERSSTLTRQLLAFSRKQIVSPHVLNLNDVIREQKSIIGRLIGEDIRIELDLDKDLWNIRIDPSQVDQILMNLAANARDAISGDGIITLETQNETLDEQYTEKNLSAIPGDYVQFTFSDSGCGMDRETRDHIFEPFFTTKDLNVGTGLGLATVYGIVNQNGGFIDVQSELGIGTTFMIFLPRFVGETEEAARAGETEITGGDETILIVEDEVQILILTRNILEKYGYRVLQANSAETALRFAEEYEGDIDLLITDVVMPAMNGKELQLRMKGIKPGIRTLFMSGYTDDVIANRGVLDKGENFIQKPFPLGTLVRTVRKILDE